MERYLIKITKENEVKFISHLDTMRTFHRALKRAKVPVSYSNGFNPHASISFAAPLSLGIASIGEYVDVDIDEFIEEIDLKERLNKALPLGMRALEVLSIKEKRPPAMKAVEGVKYSLTLNHNIEDIKTCENYIKNILSNEEILKLKKTKKGIKEVNVRPLIVDLKIASFSEEELEIEAFIKAGNNGSLSISILTEILKDYSENKITGYKESQRKNIYTLVDSKWVDLLTFYK